MHTKTTMGRLQTHTAINIIIMVALHRNSRYTVQLHRRKKKRKMVGRESGRITQVFGVQILVFVY